MSSARRKGLAVAGLASPRTTRTQLHTCEPPGGAVNASGQRLRGASLHACEPPGGAVNALPNWCNSVGRSVRRIVAARQQRPLVNNEWARTQGCLDDVESRPRVPLATLSLATHPCTAVAHVKGVYWRWQGQRPVVVCVCAAACHPMPRLAGGQLRCHGLLRCIPP